MEIPDCEPSVIRRMKEKKYLREKDHEVNTERVNFAHKRKRLHRGLFGATIGGGKRGSLPL